MKFLLAFDRKMALRVGVSVILAAAALGMFFITRYSTGKPELPPKKELSASVAAEIDREVDAILTKFRIEKSWVRKNSISLPNTSVRRIERNVAIPTDVIPIQVNVALNDMAKRYEGRAVASENLKENSVTIHIEVDGYVVQTIILKSNPELKRSGQKDGQKKA